MILSRIKYDEFILSLLDESSSEYKKLFKQQLSKTNTESIHDMLVKHNFQDVYISFRDDYRVSNINIYTPYDTPIGLYAYPLSDLLQSKKIYINNNFNTEWNDVKSIPDEKFFTNRVFPFAQDKPVIYLFHISDNSNIIFTSKDDFDKISYYLKRIYSILKNKMEISKPQISLIEDICYNYLNYKFYNSTWFKKSVVGAQALWSIIYDISNILKIKPNKFFTSIVYQIGLKGVVDDAGLGAIHPNEPIQAVFFYGYEKLIDDKLLLSRRFGKNFMLPVSKPYSEYNEFEKKKILFRNQDKMSKFFSEKFRMNYSRVNEFIKYKYLINNKIPVPLYNLSKNQWDFIYINPYKKIYKLLDIKDVHSSWYSENNVSLLFNEIQKNIVKQKNLTM